jgi:formylglycine-generating enzyme required for sulfatase activity
LLPNDLGLFDMLGNVTEWTDDAQFDLVSDRVSAALTLLVRRRGPRIMVNQHIMITRGGGYLTPAASQRSAAVPLAWPPSYREEQTGFRIVRTIRAGP